MKKSILLGFILAGSSVFASEPFLLKTQPKGEVVKSSPVFPRKSSRNANDMSNIAIKMNVTQIALKNLSFQGEWGFHNKMSAALGVSFLLERPLPGTFYSTAEHFNDPTYKGMTITPEFRFYPGGNDDKCAPRGFYIAAYMRYSKYVFTQEVSYQDDAPNSPVYTGDGIHTLKGYTAGLMIGRQWIVGQHFSIDWWILGGGFGKSKYEYTWSCPQANLTAAQQEDVKKEFTNYFGGVPIFGTETTVSTTPKSATASISGLPWYSLRMGLCLGYAF